MDIKQIIIDAATKYGIPVDYALATAQRESGFNPRAKNPNSSAGGIFQFIDSTWSEYGQGDKLDPYANADAFGRYTQNSARKLQSAGFEPNSGNLYLAHFLGPGGALNALKAPDNAYVRDMMPDVAAANPHTRNMTFAELRNWASTKAGGDTRMAALTDKKLSENEKVSEQLNGATQPQLQEPKPAEEPGILSPDTFGQALEYVADPGQQGIMARKLLGLA